MPDRLWFAIPGDIETRTGGTLYDKRVMAGLRAAGRTVTHLAWPATFPFPSMADEAQAARSLAACPDRALVLIDGLAFGVLPHLAAAEADRLRLVALVHHPLALESGLAPDIAERFVISERAALTDARAVVVTSAMTAATLADSYGVPRDRITVAKPGIDKPNPPIPPRPRTATPHLLSVGTVTPRKAHHVLIDALSLIADLDWRCTIAGSLERDVTVAQALKTQVASYGFDDRIALIGEVADVTPLYRAADILVSSSRYEGYGMAIAEAMAYGLPIVATRGGAVADVVPRSAGVLVPPDDPKPLADALRRLIEDEPYRKKFAAGARVAADALIGWDKTAALVASALDQVEA